MAVWQSIYTRYIYFLNLDNLALEGSFHHEEEHIGQLSLDSDSSMVWSVHLGGVTLSALDAQNKCHMYDINTGMHLKKISDDAKELDLYITAMTPALDTVWVALA